MSQYPFKVNYVDIKGIEGQDMAVFRIEDATNSNSIFEIYPRGRATFLNYSNGEAFAIVQTKTNYQALRLSVPGGHTSSVLDITAGGASSSTFIYVHAPDDILRVMSNETSFGNSGSYYSLVMYGGNGSTYDYVRLYSDGNTSGMIEMQNVSAGFTYCRMQPVGLGNTAYYLYTKNAQTSGYIVDVGSYNTRKFTVDYSGSVYLTGSIGVNTTPNSTYDIYARSTNAYVRVVSDTTGNPAILELAGYDNAAQYGAELRLVGRSDTFNQVGGTSSKITFNTRYNSDTGLIPTATIRSDYRTLAAGVVGTLEFIVNGASTSGVAYLVSKGASTSGCGLGINVYPSNGVDLAVAGTSSFGGVMSVDSITSYTTGANLTLSGNGTGNVVCNDFFYVNRIYDNGAGYLMLNTPRVEVTGGWLWVDNIRPWNGGSEFRVYGTFDDGVDRVSVVIDTENTFSSSGTKIVSFRNNTVEKAYIDKNGYLGTNSITAITTNTNLTLSGNGNGVVKVDDSFFVSGIAITLNDITTPTDSSANGGGIVLKGTTDKTILYSNASTRWVFNRPIEYNNGTSYAVITYSGGEVAFVGSGTSGFNYSNTNGATFRTTSSSTDILSTNGLNVSSVTARLTDTNLTLSGNGTGYVIVNDRLEVVGSIKTSNPNGGTAAEWKLGSIVTATVALDTTQYLQVDVGGTLYKVAIVS